MLEELKWKVCGLKSAKDASVAASCGADFLGFILYPKSPRVISLSEFSSLQGELPEIPKVAICVEPTPADLSAMDKAGFDFFQIHFRHDILPARLQEWSQAVGAERLWLAPKLPPSEDVPAGWLPLARYFLLDAFRADLFGGTGRTADWAKFTRHRRAHPEQTWILAGGLNPSNVADAIRQSGARWIDVNSGVESAPGVKDPAKIRAFADALRARAAGA